MDSSGKTSIYIAKGAQHHEKIWVCKPSYWKAVWCRAVRTPAHHRRVCCKGLFLRVPTAENFPLGTFRGEFVHFDSSWKLFLLQKSRLKTSFQSQTFQNTPDDKGVSHSAECDQRRCLWNLPPFVRKLDWKQVFNQELALFAQSFMGKKSKLRWQKTFVSLCQTFCSSYPSFQRKA